MLNFLVLVNRAGYVEMMHVEMMYIFGLCTCYSLIEISMSNEEFMEVPGSLIEMVS